MIGEEEGKGSEVQGESWDPSTWNQTSGLGTEFVCYIHPGVVK